jgi:pentatricopeptide repeat protein
MKAILRSLNSDLNSLAKKKMAKEAYKKLNAARRKGIPVDVHSYSNVINAFVRCRDIQRALAVHDEMIGAGIRTNTVTQTILIRGYCECLDIDSAYKVMSKIEDENLNQRTINTFLRGCLRTGSVKLAATVFDSMDTKYGMQADISSLQYYLALMTQALQIEKSELLLKSVYDNASNTSTDAIDEISGVLVMMPIYVCKALCILGYSYRCPVYLEMCKSSMERQSTLSLRRSMHKRFFEVPLKFFPYMVNLCL